MPKVLIVEDDESIREMMRHVLEIEGYSVSIANNGKEALDSLNQDSDLPSIILLDLMMPVLDGWQFLQEKSKNPKLDRIPVLVVSAAFTERTSSLQCQGLIKKPINLDYLLSEVSKHTGATNEITTTDIRKKS